MKSNHENYDKIRGKKLRCNIKREVAKISTLSWSRIVKHEYTAGKEILLSDKNTMIEETYSCLGKACVNQMQNLKINKESDSNF